MVLHMCIYDLIDIMLAVERDQVPRFGVLAREYTPPSPLSLGSTLFWHDFTLVGTLRAGVPRTGSKTPPVGDCSSSWLLWHDEKTTCHVETTSDSDPLKRDQHT